MATESNPARVDYALGDIRVEPAAHRVSRDGHELELEPKAYSVLLQFVTHPGELIQHDDLLERVWGYERFVETRSVDVHIGRLRAKLGAAGQQIETVVGLGYRFVD